MQLSEGTEPEIDLVTERLGMTSRSDDIANILTTGGSEVDGQPYKVGLPTLTVIRTFSNKSRRN